MPVSHLGLTVSHIPSATSFYLQALQPLGYRYIGQSGDSIGLGVQEADLFLTQEPRGAAVSPTHIAFSAGNRLTVRNCYAAALSAGAHPSGAPSYRNGECTVFNAAVEDLDGNVLEFVFREPSDSEEDDQTITPSEDRRVMTWQKDVARSRVSNDTESLSSRVSRAKSRAQTAMELASSASRSIRSRSEAPSSGISRAKTMPATSTRDFPSKAFFGTILGAAAGAALMFAMTSSEEDGARKEAAFSASTRSKSATRVPSVSHQTIDQPQETGVHRNFSVTESRVSRAPKSHRNFSTTESAYSRRYPPRSMRKAIAPAAYYEDEEVKEAISRFTSSRRPTAPQRSRTIDAIEYAPVSNAGDRSSRHTAKRSSTLPVDDRQGYYIEAPPKPNSTASRHSARHTTHEDDMAPKRRDSAISMGSHRSRQPADAGSHASRRSSATTVKPSRRGSQYDSAIEVPLPASKAPSAHASRRSPASTAKASRRGESTHYESAVEVPLPASIAKGPSHASAAQVPIPESHGNGWSEEESDGLGDMKTVVPDDSISCVDLTKVRSSRSSHKSSRHSSRRSEAAGSDRTVKPAKKEGSRHSAATLPVRSREEYYGSGGKSGKRSSHSLPWESYSKLGPDHPVFRYPAAVREKMYAEGVDPVVKAEMDKAIRGKVYGGPMSPIKGFKGRAKGMLSQWGTMSIGALA
ncbi:hypothetical protein LTR85_010577 [Meristemomyces frigidus]|nr:hypothetical protein LTR85_010577 [Meristemomyces frigidus]